MHRLRIRLFLSLFLGVILFNKPGIAAEVLTGNSAEGKALVELLCSRCHGTEEDTESPFVSAPVLRELSTRWPLEHLAEALAEGITVGHPAMPAFEFSSREIDDIIAYLETLKP